MTKKEYINPLNLFMYSIIFVQIGTTIRIQLDNSLIGNAMRIFGVVILLYSIIQQLHSNRKPHLNATMIFLLAWNTINIIYTAITSGINPTRTFGEEGYLLTFILPYLLLYEVKGINLKKLFSFSLIFAILAIVVILFNFEYIIMANNIDFITGVSDSIDRASSMAQIPIMWSIPSAIIFMNSSFTKQKYVVTAFIAFILATSFSMAFGRRSTSMYGIVFLVFGAYMFIKNPEYSLKAKRRFIFFISLFAIIAVMSLSHFSYLFERGLEDTRSSVNDAFHQDMETIDYIFGRGLNGTYYDPMGIFDHINNQRPGHETGYLNLMLHAGLLFLIPYVMISIRAFYIGFFKSNNHLTKSFAIYILTNTLMLLIGSYPTFNLRFFILWVGILICNNRYIRGMNNADIKEIFIIERK